MEFLPTPLPGSYLIRLSPHLDERGRFARIYCAREFDNRGLQRSFVQSNVSTNLLAGTVRGMHFQRPPHAEVKLVHCVKGSIYDVIVDLRDDSPTRLQWFGIELTEENGLVMYVPRGFAHGYQSLTEGTVTLYLTSSYYEPGFEGGCRFDDPAIGIAWPHPVTRVSEKDRTWPLMSL